MSFASFSNLFQFGAICATATFVLLIHYRVQVLETIVVRLSAAGNNNNNSSRAQPTPSDDNDKEAQLQLQSRLAHIEDELRVLKLMQLASSHQQHARQDASHRDEGRSEAGDYVRVEGTDSRAHQYEIASWSADQVQRWVERTLGNSLQSSHFEQVDGHALLDMLVDAEHGLSFGDKCFFLGVDRDACMVLERACGELLLK